VQAVGMHASKVLVSAVQQGHVAVMRRVPAKGVGGKEDVEHATAQRAVYDGDLDRVTLMGGVVLRDAESALWAAQVALDQATGDARAEGGVKAELSQNGTVESDGPQGKTSKSGTAPDKRTSAAEPAHVLAERAELAHAIRIATFYGTPARLWQGGSQVQAPVIEYSRDQRRLVARGEGTSVGNSAQVHTLLASEGSNGLVALDGGAGGAGCPAKTVASGAGPGPARVSAGGPGGMRIASGGLTYSGISREADFTGGVRAEGDGGTIRASEAVVYLQQGAGQQSAKAAAIPGSATGDLGSLSGRIDRMVANGAVTIDETGLHATGARLLYTASDQVFLLTGETGAPPKAVDAQGRSTIGAALRFHPCDASGGERIEALSVVPDTVDAGPAQRVRTEAAVEDERKTAKKRP
jgi:lipopolysaccharide export system protein LptA